MKHVFTGFNPQGVKVRSFKTGRTVFAICPRKSLPQTAFPSA
jgi:hypothetical protein